MKEKATFFEFTSHSFNTKTGEILFHYKQHFRGASPILFTEKVILPKAVNEQKLPEGLVKNLLRDLHFVLGVSYYKFYSSGIVRHHYRLSKREADFWNVLYKNGLGEFYYRNKLDPRKSPVFGFDEKAKRKPVSLSKTNKYLVALSGGKDSIVAAELLREQGKNITALFTETNRKIELVNTIAGQMGLNLVKINRYLDQKVFEKHAFDGHIPISAIYGFLGIFYSVIYGYDYFVVANEYSSNFGNIKYKGFNINHQWSKSSEFEVLFSQYIKECISPDVMYFSLVRGFYEIRIAKMFAKYKQYFPYFSGCNKNFTLVKGSNQCLWCGECPKCVFTFILLSPFLSKKELLTIFQGNIYENAKNLQMCEDILGLGRMKPFDCVGTFEESQAAFILGSKKFEKSLMVKMLLPKIKITKEQIEHLFRTQPSSLVPINMKFLGMENVLLMGYGKEGQVSREYIKKKYPRLAIGIADEKRSKEYLSMQRDFDIAIKSPGIHKSLVAIPYTTATNLFFSKVKEKGNLIIGVTGSKGKSTTASLIYAMLKEARIDVVLVGNIGKPMLKELLKPIPRARVFVVELSSYQLDDIQFSPDIAVVTNLFPEHLDYHGSTLKYYQAKKNIIRFQNEGDIFVYNKNNAELVKWTKEAVAKTVSFSLLSFETSLLGRHNKENIGAAVSVAKQFNIPDILIKNVLARFKSLPHRMQRVGTYKGITFIDDANAAIPQATIMAIEALGNVDTIFLGGQDRGYNFSQLEKTIKKYKISNVVLFPDSGNRMKLYGVKILKTKSMQEAVVFAYKNTKKGSICLLSCASPSYSLWKNFEEKGDQFISFVKKLGKP